MFCKPNNKSKMEIADSNSHYAAVAEKYDQFVDSSEFDKKDRETFRSLVLKYNQKKDTC